MPGNPREMITSAERRFPVRIRVAVPPAGLGQRYTQITAWLDANCGADEWAMTPREPAACRMTPSRFTLPMPRWRARLSPGGASGPRPRRLEECFKFVRMSPSRGSGRGCIRRHKGAGEIPPGSAM
jgi:hypothetical protein